jgi:hypothetical protein
MPLIMVRLLNQFNRTRISHPPFPRFCSIALPHAPDRAHRNARLRAKSCRLFRPRGNPRNSGHRPLPRRRQAAPRRSCCALRNTLESERQFSPATEPAGHRLLDKFRPQVPPKLRLDSARMQRRYSNAALFEPAIEGHREQDIRGLRTPVSQKWLIFGSLEVRIFKAHIAALVPPHDRVTTRPPGFSSGTSLLTNTKVP